MLFSADKDLKRARSHDPFRRLLRWTFAVGVCSVAPPASADQVAFTSALDDSPLAVKPLPNEAITDAVTKFY